MITVFNPIVTIATAKTGLPTIGLNVSRSTITPVAAAKSAPMTSATQNDQFQTVAK